MRAAMNEINCPGTHGGGTLVIINHIKKKIRFSLGFPWSILASGLMALLVSLLAGCPKPWKWSCWLCIAIVHVHVHVYVCLFHSQ